MIKFQLLVNAKGLNNQFVHSHLREHHLKSFHPLVVHRKDQRRQVREAISWI